MNLNGYTLKAVKMTEVRRGIAYTGNIYYNGKQIGSAHNDGDGGMTFVDLPPEHRSHDQVLDEEFVERLFTLNDYESLFRENVPIKPDLGFGGAMVIFNPFDLDCSLFPKDETMDEVLTRIRKDNPGREIESVELFRSLADFNIDQDHKPELYENPAVVGADEDMDSGITMS